MTILRRSNRVVDALLQTIISYLLGNFNVFYDTISSIGLESTGIDFKLEAIFIYYFDSSGRKRIQLCHTLNIRKLHVVTILEFIIYVKIASDYARVSSSDSLNTE